ncbi:MAG TPA: serine/threonine-protein kinase [Ktedonobacteraceae bacterium]|nr:serine/threonine-protein kinase [Ktedonobacteraceae bacterium]
MSSSQPPADASGASATPAFAADSGRSKQRRLAPGTELSSARYKIERIIASGGMGAVYRAIDTRFNRPCAVKEMLDEFQQESERAQAVEWFSREATLLLDLNHPCIPRVRDFFVEQGRHYLVMDFIEGWTLAQLLEKEGNVVGVNGAHGIPEVRARSWAQQVCSVLTYLHRQTPPIIFRDLKPANIMVTDRDEIKLIDFGIARTFQSQRQSTIILTIGYAPPEQLHGMPEPRSDLYALGATLHRVLTHHDAASNKPSIFSFPPLRTLRPDLSPAFEQVVMRALEPIIDRRWPGAQEMERALLNLPPVTVVPPVAPVGSPLVAGQRPSGPQHLTPNSVPVSGSEISSPQTFGTTGPAGLHILNAQRNITAHLVENAYTDVQKAYMAEPGNALVHKLFGQIYALRVPPQPDVAVRAYNRSLELNPDDAETHKLVGDVYLYILQQPLNGIPAYVKSTNLNARDYETHQRLAICYERTNQLELALRAYQEAARLLPEQPPQPALFYSLGQLAMRLNQWPVAEHAFVRVLIINPGDHMTRFLLSQVYEYENKLEEAFRECSYVVGPLNANPAVQQMHQRLRTLLRK